MTLKEFIQQYDHPGSVALLEGKRTVLEADKEKLKDFGSMIALKTKHLIFRSGNASGSDELFINGVKQVAPERIQLVIPYKNHRNKHSESLYTYSMEECNIVVEEEVLYLSKQNIKTKNLIDQYANGVRNSYSIKAAYIIRDTLKVTGIKGQILPASFGFFYDDLDNPETGGAGHTMKVCKLKNIPYINQNIWMEWLNRDKTNA